MFLSSLIYITAIVFGTMAWQEYVAWTHANRSTAKKYRNMNTRRHKVDGLLYLACCIYLSVMATIVLIWT